MTDAIAEGQVVGWFQGPMRFGPRALGYGSTLCDPRRPDMRDRINPKIKLGESFRPFAPSILRERKGEWFEVDDDVPFMMKVYAIRPEKRDVISAVTQVDGTGRRLGGGRLSRDDVSSRFWTFLEIFFTARIKLREPFRPFAPWILRESMGEWFTVDDDVPFMMKVHPIRPDKWDRVPAVTHVDGTGRPQTVTRDAHPLYYRLIRAFAERTGVPMILNTSFNENEPIVHRPEEALDCLLRTDMDVLVLGSLMVHKASALDQVESR